MDFNPIIKTAAPIIISLLQTAVTSWLTPAPPPLPSVVPPGTVPHPSAAIKDLQALLNKLITPTPALNEDGWLGPKTEAAIETAIARLKAQGIG